MPLAAPSKKRTEAKDHTLTSKTTHKFYAKNMWIFHHLKVLGFLSFLASKSTPPTLGRLGGDEKNPASSKASVERWSWACFSHQQCYRSSPPNLGCRHIMYISFSFHHFKIWTKHLIEMQSIQQNDATTKVRRTLWILKVGKRHYEKPYLFFFLCGLQFFEFCGNFTQPALLVFQFLARAMATSVT